MKAAANAHPSPAVLAAFALGQLDESAAETVDDHLASCDFCREQAARTPPDTFVSWLRSARRSTVDGTPGATPSPGRRKGPVETGAYVNPVLRSDGSVSLPESFGRYRILRKIGQGGMGSVFLARDTQLDRQVALKVPHFRAGIDTSLVERFYREARAAAAFDHPNLCPVYDVGCLDGVHYLTMPHIEGASLAEYLATGKALPIRPVVGLVRKMALAMQVAHARGVVHRDLKPGNVLINARREPVIMDFGLARLSAAADAHLTEHGTLLGTPAYMAPEQVRGDLSAIGPACDIYALGVILYELLTGQLPFQGPATAVLVQIVTEDPPPIAQLRPEVSPLLEGICRKMMARSIAARYASMADVAAALTVALRPLPSSPPPSHGGTIVPPPLPSPGDDSAEPPLSEPLPAPARRRRKPRPGRPLLIGTGLSCGLLLLLGIVLTFSGSMGTIRIAVNDPTAQVEVTVDHDVYTLTALGKPLRLRIGEHDLIVTGPDFETVTRKFTVRRGANPVYTVELVPKAKAAATPPKLPVPVPGNGQWDKGGEFRKVKELTGHTGEVHAVGFAAAGKRAITGSRDRTARVWDPETGECLAELIGHTDVVVGVALSPDGKLALTGSADQTVGLWDTDSGTLLHQFKGHAGMVRSTAFSPDGRLAASAGDDRTIRLYDVGKRSELRQLTGHGDVVSSVAFGPDSDRLASGSWDRTVRLWDVAEGKQLKQYVGHSGWVQAVAYSPDGRRLLSGSGGAMKGNQYHGQPDCSARVWDVESRKELLKLSADWGGVCTVAFLPDSRHILFAEWRPFRGDRFLFLWDAETNREIARYQDPNSLSPTVAVATNGKQVVTGRAFNAGPAVHVFTLPARPGSK